MENYLNVIVNKLDEISNTLKNNINWLKDSFIPLLGVVLGFLLSEVKNWSGKTFIRNINAGITSKNNSEIYDQINGMDEACSIEEAVIVHIALEFEIYNSSPNQKMVEVVGIEYETNQKKQISQIYNRKDKNLDRRNISIIRIDPYSSVYFTTESVIAKEKMKNLPELNLIFKKRIIRRKIRVIMNSR